MYLKKKLAQPENFLIWRGFNLAQLEKKNWRGFNLAISGKLRQLRQIFSSAPKFVRIRYVTLLVMSIRNCYFILVTVSIIIIFLFVI